MKIYIDYVFFINFLFDFILLISLSMLLKRNPKLKRIILGSLFGGLTIIILFLPISSFLFFLSKIICGFFMLIITFGFKDLKYTMTNLIYLMVLSILLGGTLYLINLEKTSSHSGMLFFTNKDPFNIIILIIISAITMILYVKIESKNKKERQFSYQVTLKNNNQTYNLNAFLDTGNNLKDPYFDKPIIILNKGINLESEKSIFVPFKTLNSEGLMKCLFIEELNIKEVGNFKNVLVGLSNDKFHLSGVDIILHRKFIEGGQNE